MSEADTANGRATPDPTDPRPGIESEQVGLEANLTNSTEAPINPPAVSQAQEQPLVNAASPTNTEEPELIIAADELAAFTAGADEERSTTSHIDDALTWQSDSDVAELVALNEALHKQNTELLNHVEQLEKLLDECHSALQSQTKRSQSLETKLNQHTQEFTSAQDQVTRLFRELEAAHKTSQRQQILIETLSQQLQSSQEQVAQLERDCALTQQRYNEQSYQMSQTEVLCQELRSRLQRQQRYTLQFKAALDKCLEMPALAAAKADIGDIPITIEIPQLPPQTLSEQRFLLKPQPIQPWSAGTEYTAEETISEPSNSTSEQPFISAWSAADAGNAQAQEDLLTENPLKESLQPFAAPAESYLSPEPDWSLESISDITQNLRDTEEGLWRELERLTQEAVTPSSVISSENIEPTATVPEFSVDVPLPVQPDRPIDVSVVQEEVSSEPVDESILPELAPETSSTTETPGQLDAYSPYINWPSPVVYPARPPKKIKSLAAIDLPSFPRLSEGRSAPAK